MPDTPPLPPDGPPVTVEPHNVRGPNAEPDEVAEPQEVEEGEDDTTAPLPDEQEGAQRD